MALVNWFCGEDIEFPVKDSSTISILSSTVHRANVRAALQGSANLTIGTKLADSVPFTALTSCWFSFRVYRGTNFFTANKPEIGLGGSAALGGLFIGNGAVAGRLS